VSSDTFLTAVARAASSYSAGTWEKLTISEQCSAIYRELRKLDSESLEE
jgi:hypothetical protein